jgi:hypothetical protein
MCPLFFDYPFENNVSIVIIFLVIWFFGVLHGGDIICLTKATFHQRALRKTQHSRLQGKCRRCNLQNGFIMFTIIAVHKESEVTLLVKDSTFDLKFLV